MGHPAVPRKHHEKRNSVKIKRAEPPHHLAPQHRTRAQKPSICGPFQRHKTSNPRSWAKDAQKSRVANGSTFLAGADGRSLWVRRAKEIVAAHQSDVPDASAAERSLIRRIATLTVELERMEVMFATAGEADPETLDLYARVAGNLRRLLEAVGLRRRPKDVTPTVADYVRHINEEAGPIARKRLEG